MNKKNENVLDDNWYCPSCKFYDICFETDRSCSLYWHCVINKKKKESSRNELINIDNNIGNN